jgi:hypothetical protein
VSICCCFETTNTSRAVRRLWGRTGNVTTKQQSSLVGKNPTATTLAHKPLAFVNHLSITSFFIIIIIILFHSSSGFHHVPIFVFQILAVTATLTQ